MTYDSHRRRVVLFGGLGSVYYRDTWEWDGAAWTLVNSSDGPSIREGAEMAYDAVRRRTVLFGGWIYNEGFRRYDDTWEWDGTRWEQRFPIARPSLRGSPGFAYDSRAGRILLFGGITLAFPYVIYHDDLWSYSTDSVGDYRTYGASCAGSMHTPTLATREPGDRPWLGQTFALAVSGLAPSQPVAMLTGFSDTTWNGLRLPLPLEGIGMPGCTLYIAPDVVSGLSNNAGTAVWSAPIPLDASLRGLPFFNQAIVFDPAANALGIVTTNAGAGVVGVL